MIGSKYGFDIRYSEEDSGFIATCPDFPGLSAFGTTRAEVLREGEVVLNLFIESLKAAGQSLPEPMLLSDREMLKRLISKRYDSAWERRQVFIFVFSFCLFLAVLFNLHLYLKCTLAGFVFGLTFKSMVARWREIEAIQSWREKK